MADSLCIVIGDFVATVYLRIDLNIYNLKPKFTKFNVVEIFKSNIDEYDKHWAFIYMQDVMRISTSNQAEMIKIRTKSIDSIDRVKKLVLDALNVSGTKSFFAQDLRDTNRPLFVALRVEKWIIGAIYFHL